MTPAEEQRAAMVERYRAAFLAANGREAEPITWTGMRFHVGRVHKFTTTGIRAATERLEARAIKKDPA